MLTQNFTKTLRHATAGAELAHYQSTGLLQSSSIDRPAYGLNCRYWIRDLLLAGRHGTVYQAHDLTLNRPCAVKRIESSVKVTCTLQQRFVHEAEILTGLSHPNIVEVYECTPDEQGNLFSVMEPLDGSDLHSLLAKTSHVPVERTLEIVCAVGAALQHTHDLGIVHRDINPRSIFLNTERSRTALAVEVVKVMNFGLAKQMATSSDLERNLHLGLVFDSPTYLAPEALELSSECVDGRADQWSLAVVAYQMLSGQLPFWHHDPWCLRELIRGSAAPIPLSELMPELPSHVLGAIKKALSKDRSQRYGHMIDFIRALHGLPTSASRPTKPEHRVDLIEQCRPVSPLAAAPIALPVEAPTREYPALSFPAELLASADAHQVLELFPGLPVPQLTPPWTAGPEPQRSWRPGWRFWLVSCLVMALAPAPVIAALHYLRAAPHTRARSYKSSAQSAPAQPRMEVAARPRTLDALTMVPQASAAQNPAVRKPRPTQPHHAHSRALRRAALDALDTAVCRNQSRQHAQATLAEGLGL